MEDKIFVSYRKEAKKDYGKYFDSTVPKEDRNLTTEQLKMGALLRIADATEKMTSNYVEMENDLKNFRQRVAELLEENARLLRSNRALKGHLKRLKK